MGSRPIHTLDAVLLLDILGTLEGFLVAVVPNGHIGARLGKSLSYRKTNTGTGTRHDCRLSLVGEQRHHLLFGGRYGVVVGKVTLGHGTVRHDVRLCGWEGLGMSVSGNPGSIARELAMGRNSTDDMVRDV